MSAGIYIHIPFCKQKCLYCDFVSKCGTEEEMKQYKDALLGEIESTDITESVDSIFFGGGTPSIFPVNYIEEILEKIREKYDILENSEITLEANPGTLEEEKIKAYLKMGINRLSIGLQSANDEELRTLGRIHNYSEFLKNYKYARKCGFKNINIDIMSSLPNQSFKGYSETLKKIVKLSPEHISAYSLIVEENTPFFEKYNDEDGEYFEQLPDEDTDREMYHFTKEFLEKNGYNRYEISNYSKPGFECRHNLKYWSGENYYGFGVAAASLKDDIRYVNISDVGEYIACQGDVNEIREDIDKLSIEDQMEEYMFVGLRRIKGVSISGFKKKFGKTMKEIYGDTIKKNILLGLLDEDFDRVYLTEKGLDVSNIVMAEFLFD